MPTRQKIIKLTPPLSWNGSIALYQLRTDRIEVDEASGNEVIVFRRMENLFGHTKDELRALYVDEKANVSNEKTGTVQRLDESIAALDQQIADLDAS